MLHEQPAARHKELRTFIDFGECMYNQDFAGLHTYPATSPHNNT